MSFNFCPKCGVKNPNLDPFCSNCGYGEASNENSTETPSKKETEDPRKTSKDLAWELWKVIQEPSVEFVSYERIDRFEESKDNYYANTCDECGGSIENGELITKTLQGISLCHHRCEPGRFQIGGKEEKFLGAYPIEIGLTPSKQCRLGRIRDWTYSDFETIPTGFPGLIWQGSTYIRIFLDGICRTKEQRDGFPLNRCPDSLQNIFGLQILLLSENPDEEMSNALSNIRSSQPLLHTASLRTRSHSSRTKKDFQGAWWAETVRRVTPHMKYLEIRAGENPIYIGPEKRNARKLDEEGFWTDSKLGIQNASLNDLELYFKQLQHN